MRLSLLLLVSICMACKLATAQKIRLKSLQFGPALGVQVSRPDTTMENIRKLVKDPQNFPKNSIDTLERESGRGMLYGSAGHVQVSLLTAWEFISKKEKPVFKKEWRIGVEYSYISNRQEFWSTPDSFHVAQYVDTDVYFHRHNHLLGLYTDFIFKKGFSRDRFAVYAGAGGYVSHSIGGFILETKVRKVEYREADVEEKHRHATAPRRDIAVLFPMGIAMRPGGTHRPLGMTFGLRPGFMIIKEKNDATFITGMIGYSMQLVYHFH